MIDWTNAPLVRHIEGGPYWLLEEAFVYTINGQEYIIPAKFKTDYGSSRLGPIEFLPYKAKYCAMCVIHDWEWRNCRGFFKSNKHFFYGLRKCNVSLLVRIYSYLAVTLFGWPIYLRRYYAKNGFKSQ